MEALEERAAAPLLAHLRECPDCRGAYEQVRRSHLDRIRMYDQLDRGHDSSREQLMAALPPQPARSRADRLVRGWRHTGDFAMSIKNTVGARAAIGLVSAAACIAFVVFLMTFAGSRDAFAAAIGQFHNAKTIVCRVSATAQTNVMDAQATGKLYVSAEYGSRMTSSMFGSVMMITYTPLEGPETFVNVPGHTYTVVNRQAAEGPGDLENEPDGFILALTKLKGQADRELGRRDIDGIDALGYEITGQMLGLGRGEGVRSELWVDAATYLPVRYVAEVPGPQPGGTQMVFDQFEWDTPLDPELFTPDIPADYTRIEATAPSADQAALIKGLGNYAELAGKYPSSLDTANVATDVGFAVAARIASALRRGEEAPDQQEMMQKSVEIGAAVAFYQKLVSGGLEPEYNGKTVKPGQADAVLLRWKLTEGQWRVIYGDLQVDTISAD